MAADRRAGKPVANWYGLEHDDAVPAHDAAVVVAKLLKQMYPANPDVVLGREARRIIEALTEAGYTLVRSDSWRLRNDFDVIPHLKEEQLVKGPPSDD